MDYELIGRQHYGRVGDLSDELWNETSVKSSVAFLHRHKACRLKEVLVFASLFSESRPNYLCRRKEAKTKSIFQDYSFFCIL